MATSIGTGKGMTPLGQGIRDYIKGVRTGYQASRDAKKSRTDALKDARTTGKAAWTTDKTAMQTSGYLRKKTSNGTPGNGTATAVSMPPVAGSTQTSSVATGGFRSY